MNQSTHPDEKQIEEGLEAIYGNDQVDFTTVDRGRPRVTSILLTVVITLGVIALTAWTAFFVYSSYFAPQEDKQFTLAIEAPDDAVSGAETTVTVHYENPTPVPLASLRLEVNLPDAFDPTHMSPEPDDREEYIWDIGPLGAGSDGSLTLTGIWLASVPSSTPVQVFATYRPANFNADFSEIETRYINTQSSVLAVDMQGPEEGKPGEKLDYDITVTNTGDTILTNAVVTLDLPDGFFLEESSPTVEAGKEPLWQIESLAPQTEVNIHLSGSFAADQEGFHYFTATSSLAVDDTQLNQSSNDAFTDVLRHDLSLQVVANGTPEDVTVGLGSDLRITVALDNTGDTNIDTTDLLLSFDSDESLPIVWAKANLDRGKITSDGIEWSAETVGDLAPGEKQQFNITVPIDNTVGNGQSDTFDVLAIANAESFEIKSSPIHVSIATEADLEARVRYYDDQGGELGTGPLPPTVSETTEYRLYWTIHNDLHDVKHLEVSATLPPHVTWVGVYHTDLGTITFNETSRTMTWEISSLPTSIPTVEAYASLRITPEADDVGTFVKLVSSATMKATDTVTNTLISDTTDSLDTELIGDEFAEGKGVVVEAP